MDSKRIQSIDAIFVDIIHTNSGELSEEAVSFPDALGHIDFYPNGGSHQKGCTDFGIGDSFININYIESFRRILRIIQRGVYYKELIFRIYIIMKLLIFFNILRCL